MMNISKDVYFEKFIYKFEIWKIARFEIFKCATVLSEDFNSWGKKTLTFNIIPQVIVILPRLNSSFFFFWITVLSRLFRSFVGQHNDRSRAFSENILKYWEEIIK